MADDQPAAPETPGAVMMDPDMFIPEEMIRPLGMRVDRLNRDDGSYVTIIRFQTPFKKYSFRLDDPEDSRDLATALNGGIQIAKPGDLP